MSVCQECGENHSDPGDECLYCGTAIPKSRQKPSKFKIFMAIAFVAVIFLSIRHFIRARPNGPLPKITAHDLILDYQVNSENASIEHDGQWVRVSGVSGGKGGGDMLETKYIVLRADGSAYPTDRKKPEGLCLIVELELNHWRGIQDGHDVTIEGRIKSLSKGGRYAQATRSVGTILIEEGVLIVSSRKIKKIPHVHNKGN